MTVDQTLARCEALRDGRAEATRDDLAWLVECFEHPIRSIRRTAADAVAVLAEGGVRVDEALRAALVPGPFDRRWVAAWTWARIFGVSDAAARDVLVEALGVDDGDVRWAAARALTSTADADVRTRLCATAAAGNDEQRKMAIYCLRDLGARDERAVALFQGALTDAAAGVRLAAMNALARADEGREAARAIGALLSDPDGGVRRAAVATLSRLGITDPEVTARLRSCAESDDPILARAASAALARLC